MANCVGCHRQIQDDLAFCPICGEDNRPPEHRQPVMVCNHHFMPGMPCCVLCGAAYDEPAGSTPVTRHRAVVRWILVGASLVVVLAYILTAGHTNGLPLSIQAHELFGLKYRSYYRSSYGYYRSYPTDLGTEISTTLAILAVGCFVQSYRLQKKLESMDDMDDITDWAWWRWFWF